jgi:hypothetical protein
MESRKDLRDEEMKSEGKSNHEAQFSRLCMGNFS